MKGHDPNVAVVGCGAWGKNVVRTFAGLGVLRAVSDADVARAAEISTKHGVPARSLNDILEDVNLPAVAIASSAPTHATIARRALTAGKHVLVEKPLALDVGAAIELDELASRQGLTLMVGHLLQYHNAFIALKAIVDKGELGHLQYLYSSRLNLGRFRREENILWSFAPHDISLLLALVGAEPAKVTAVGASYLHPGRPDITTTHLQFPGGEQAHVFVSWLHPFKEHRLVVVGSEGMAVFDDGQPWSSKLVTYTHRVSWAQGGPHAVPGGPSPVALEEHEPLAEECRHFLDCVAIRSTPRTDGAEGIRVLRVLDAAERSMRDGARESSAPPTAREGVASPDAFIHPSSYVDEADVGSRTRIWHFSHILNGTRIGRNCTVGQNVSIGPDVVIGDDCKIQNNVSIYTGVTLEDGVFCGPSCVFTNVLTPRATVSRRDEFLPTLVRRGATIGANATIVCGHTIGAYSMIGAGAVVTSDVPDHALMVGVPARRIGWVSHAGEVLGPDLVCPRTGQRYREVSADRLEELPNP